MFIARQPILNKNKKTFAYELLYRTDKFDNKGKKFDGDKATAQVITGGLGSIGFEELTEGKKAFINFTENLLTEEVITILPEDLVGIEILETVRVTEEVVEKCKQLKDRGYLIILDDFIFKHKFTPLIELADIIKVDVLNTGKKEIEKIINKVNPQISLLAEKVETNEAFNWASDRNFAYFQGYFFSKPETISHKELPASKMNYIRLLNEINKSNPDFNRMEKIIKNDLSMSYTLLKVINSAYFGLNSRIKSIKQALILLGTKELRKWLTLYLMRDLSEEKPDVLIKTALIRANFAEYFASLLHQENKRLDFYMMGLLSMIDAFFDMPLAKILNKISVPVEIKRGLIDYEGTAGKVIKLIICYEKGYWQEVKLLKKKLNLDKEKLFDVYLKALKDINKTIDQIS